MTTEPGDLVLDPTCGSGTTAVVAEALGRALQDTIVPARLKAYQGTKSLPFKPGENLKVAVKIIDARGFESIRVFALTEEGRPRGEVAR